MLGEWIVKRSTPQKRLKLVKDDIEENMSIPLFFEEHLLRYDENSLNELANVRVPCAIILRK